MIRCIFPGVLRFLPVIIMVAMGVQTASGSADSPQYLCVVDGIDDATKDFSPPAPTDARMACLATIHYTLRTPTDTLLDEIEAALNRAETSGYPVFLTFDDWNFPPPEWKDNPMITEWTDWNGTLCTGRDIEWASDNPQNPPPNVASPTFRALLAPRLDAAFAAIAGRARAWDAAGKGYLFAGVALGWESGYYTDFDAPDPLRTGFAALTSRGFDDESIASGAAARGVTYWEEFDARMAELVHDYIAWFCRRAVRAGIPREAVFTHFTGVPDDWTPPAPEARDGRLLPFSLAGNPWAHPGHTATVEWIDLERLATEAAERGTPDWAASEWEATSQTSSRRAMLQYLSRLYHFGARVTVNWGGWWGPWNPYRVDGTPGEQGMKDWLAGEDAPGVGVRAGRSALLGPVDYADGWTEGINGRVADGTFPVVGPALDVETIGQNPARRWSDARWSLRKDVNVFWTASSPDPRGNWSGSRTGMTETGGSVDFGIEYGLRDDFVVQVDAVQTDDAIALTSAGVRDTTERADGITVRFRAVGAPIEVGLYSAEIGEHDTGFRPALRRDLFHNVAVRFRVMARELWIYANGSRLGIVDLETFSGGAFAGVPLSGAAVTVSGSTVLGDRVWTDNFQVGAPCPEPEAISRLELRRSGDDILLDWRTDPGVAHGWQVVERTGPGLSQRTPLATTSEKRWTDAGAASMPGIRYYGVEGVNDCP